MEHSKKYLRWSQALYKRNFDARFRKRKCETNVGYYVFLRKEQVLEEEPR